MKKQIEILAPAGSYEGMKAAMNAGCDAVYIGGSSFGARAHANNLDEENLLRAIDEVHLRDKRLYLTVNTLIKERELNEKLYGFLEKLYLQGLDAVIVQDVGVMKFIHHHFPELPIHASTQTTLTMAQGANLLKKFGVTRLVTARELSFNEIKVLRQNTNMEIETFVHGALCYCYSGQCLMSSMIGGRSGNRGRCAQPCRMPYQFISGGEKRSSEEEKYLLSPKDINTITLIPEMIEAGIDSFKIEGRMKRPEYAAVVAAAYRKYVDLYHSLGKEKYNHYIQTTAFEEDMIELSDIYNRGGFSKGYGKMHHGKSMMSLSRPNHSGTYVGEVLSVKGNQVAITLKEKVNAQDILEIRRREEAGYEFTLGESFLPGAVLKTYCGRRSKSTQQSIQVGDQVYRTKNNNLLERISSDYLKNDKKQGIKGKLKAKVDQKLELDITYHDISVTAYHDIVPVAQKIPMSKEKLKYQIEKTGDTIYYFEELEVDFDDNVFVPVAWLNEIRREAIQHLQEAVMEQYRRKQTINIKENSLKMEQINSEALGVCVSVQTMDQFNLALSFGETTSIYVDYDSFLRSKLYDLAKEANIADKEFYLVLPPICRIYEYDRLKNDIIPIIGYKELTGFVAKNFEEVSLLQSLMLKEEYKKEIILDYNMYIFNREAKAFWSELGVYHYTAPLELNRHELKLLGTTDCDIVVYGLTPLMVTAQCLFDCTDGCRQCKASNSDKNGYLVDRLNKKFYVRTNCKGRYNMIYNGQHLSLIKQASEVLALDSKNIRLDFTIETKDEMEQVLTAFMDRFVHGRTNEWELNNYTLGHFKRGIE